MTEADVKARVQDLPRLTKRDPEAAAAGAHTFRNDVLSAINEGTAYNAQVVPHAAVVTIDGDAGER